MRHQARRVVLCEIQSALAVLRRNARFATAAQSSGTNEDGSQPEENSLTRDLKALREAVRDWPTDDLAGFDTLQLVAPFLLVVRSREANGIITDAALRSLQAFMGAHLIEEESARASEAVEEVVEALIGCRFEETQLGHDEAVRARILQVLVECLEGGVGTWLPNEVVWELLQTCMANLDQMSAQSPLLRTAAEDGVFRVVRWLFLRLPGTQETPLRDTTAAAAAARLQTYSKMQHPSSGSAIGAFRNEAVQQPTGNAPTSEGDTVGHGKGKYMNDSKKNPSKVDVNSSPTEAWAGSGKGGALNTLHRPATERAGTAAAAVLATAENGRRCGLPCVVNVFGFLCSQLLKHGGGGGRSGFSGSGSAAVGGSSGGGGGSAPTPRRVLCLRLMRTALAAAGSALALYPPLLEMVQDDLFFSLMHLLQRSGGVNVVGEVLSIAGYLWGSLRVHLKVQFERLFGILFLRGLAQLKEFHHSGHGIEDGGATGPVSSVPLVGGDIGSRHDGTHFAASAGVDDCSTGVGLRVFKDRELEMILECLCDFMSDPTFLTELYVNYDCDVERSNLTEALVAAIADGAYAAPDRLPGARASCLTALSLALRRLHVRCAAGDTDDVPSTAVGGDPLDDSDRTVLMVSTVCGGGSAAGSEVLVASSCMSEIAAAAAAAVGSTGLHAPSHCREARRRKHARARGARAFCVKPREGLKLLQEEGVLRPGALDATEVAMFLRTAHGLNKTALGSYLGEAGVKGGTATTASIARGKNLRVNTLEKEGKRQQQQQQQSDSYRNARDEPQEKDYKPIVSAEGPAAETISLAAEKQGSTNAARVSESTGVIVEGGRENSGLEPSAVYRGDTAEFHAEVLDAFVETFDFKGQGLLASLRMFLEAFRLPGEAQQIDRILHTFALRAYRDCLESGRGMLASADVAYLLSFSVIMLNTDLHNPNIRPENRMSGDGFVLNNTNYGRDISRGTDLPRDFLESVYASIKDDPITTYGAGPDALVTPDGWQDLLRRQRKGNPMAVCRKEACARRSGGLAEHDRDLITACWPAVLKAASAAFASGHGQVPSELGASVDLFLLITKLAGYHQGLQKAFDKVIILLCRFTGLLDDGGSKMDTGAKPSTERGSTRAMAPVAAAKSLNGSVAARTAAVTVLGIAHRLGDHMGEGWVPLLRLVFAMRDLHLLPEEVLTESEEDLLEARERVIFNVAVRTGRFRIAAATAAAAAAAAARHKDSGEDAQGDDAEGGTGDGRESGRRDEGGSVAGGSILSWMLGRSAAAAADNRGQYEPVDVPSTPQRTARTAVARHLDNSKEAGLEGDGGDQLSIENWNETGDLFYNKEASLNRVADDQGSGAKNTDTQGQNPSTKNGDEEHSSSPSSFGPARQCAAQCRVQDLVGESRRLDADALVALVQALIAIVHVSLPFHERQGLDFTRGFLDGGMAEPVPHGNGEAGGSETGAIGWGFCPETARYYRQHVGRGVSAASLAFAEVLIAEIALRNRERIALVLPLLLEHYRRRLAAATHASFSVEKAATGLLRLASRLFSRPGLALPLTRALTYVTPPHTRPVLFESLVGHVSAAMRRLVMSVGGGKGGGEMEGEEWGAVLSVLEACAGTGGRSEADTFESVCLLVHNQNLKELLPIERATACVSAFFVQRERNLPMHEDGDASVEGSERDGNIFAAAALDLLMVLHARLPSGNNSGGSSNSSSTDSSSSSSKSDTPASTISAVTARTAIVTRGRRANSALEVVDARRVGGSGSERLGGRSDGEDARAMAGLDAWMVVLSALSLGAMNEESEVAMHALQLLTKALTDNHAAEAPPEALQEVMLSIVIPLARHVWHHEGRHMAWGCGDRQRRRRRPPISGDKDEFSGEVPVLDDRRRLQGPSSSNDTPSNATNENEGYTSNRRSPSGQSRLYRGNSGNSASSPSPRHSPSRASLQSSEGDPAETTADGFELVEVPQDGSSPGREVRRSATRDLDPSSGRGSKRSDDSRRRRRRNDDDVGEQLSSPALLALLMVLKSFLKHLSSLRQAGDFYEVWCRLLSCLDALLGNEGYAPPSLVDGAVAGLGALLREMHREGLFVNPLNDGGKDDRLETKLWTFTCEKVSQFTCCPGLIQDMFEDGDELDLPFARGKPVPTMMETLYDKGITQVDERA